MSKRKSASKTHASTKNRIETEKGRGGELHQTASDPETG